MGDNETMAKEVKEMLTFAIDFDGTLCEDVFPKIGEAHPHMIHITKTLQLPGHKMILWTCRRDERLAEAVEWCREKGLIFDAVNSNLPDNIEKYGGDTRKVSADIYIDDKNGFYPEMVEIIKRYTEAQ